jgi:hypothetical protein
MSAKRNINPVFPIKSGFAIAGIIFTVGVLSPGGISL